MPSKEEEGHGNGATASSNLMDTCLFYGIMDDLGPAEAYHNEKGEDDDLLTLVSRMEASANLDDDVNDASTYDDSSSSCCMSWPLHPTPCNFLESSKEAATAEESMRNMRKSMREIASLYYFQAASGSEIEERRKIRKKGSCTQPCRGACFRKHMKIFSRALDVGNPKGETTQPGWINSAGQLDFLSTRSASGSMQRREDCTWTGDAYHQQRWHRLGFLFLYFVHLALHHLTGQGRELSM
jgi:hypothetical protein